MVMALRHSPEPISDRAGLHSEAKKTLRVPSFTAWDAYQVGSRKKL
jgi:hypothetical protein